MKRKLMLICLGFDSVMEIALLLLSIAGIKMNFNCQCVRIRKIYYNSTITITNRMNRNFYSSYVLMIVALLHLVTNYLLQIEVVVIDYFYYIETPIHRTMCTRLLVHICFTDKTWSYQNCEGFYMLTKQY